MGVIIGLILALVEITETLFIEIYMRDEQGASWIVYKDWKFGLFGYQYDIKIGKFMWIRVYFSTMIFAWPLWYGGRELGHAGI